MINGPLESEGTQTGGLADFMLILASSSSMSLSKSLESISSYLDNRVDRNNNCYAKGRIITTTVIVLQINAAPVSDREMEETGSLMGRIKKLEPNSVVVYVTSPLNSANYRTLSERYANDVLLEVADSISQGDLAQRVAGLVSGVPASIVNFFCNSSRTHVEDYVTPGVGSLYEINALYLQVADFSVMVSM